MWIRRWLYQSTHSAVANSTSASLRQAAAFDQFGLVQPDRGLQQGVVQRVADGADIGGDALAG